MKICKSATLTKILLGIAGAGALFALPVRAEAPLGDSSEVSSEAPATTEVSPPSGAEQLLPLNPPSAPVDPAGTVQPEPVTPASSLESPVQDSSESIGGADSVEATEPTEGASEELPEDDAPASGIEEEAPTDGEDGTEAVVEEEDAAPVGGTEDIAPADDLSSPVEGSVESETPEDSSLTDEDPSLTDDVPEETLPSEESELSPSSAVPGSTGLRSQLLAEGSEPSAPPEAAPPEAAPEEGTSESVPPAAAPSTTPVSDQELQQFANTVPELRTIEQGTQEEIAAVIQGSGFDEARFNEIYQSQQSPDASAAEVTESEKQSFTKALSDIRAIEEKSKVEQEKVIQAQGLEPERFVEILISLRQDPALQTKVQQMIPN